MDRAVVGAVFAQYGVSSPRRTRSNDLAPAEWPAETWSEPYDDPADFEECLRFALSRGLPSSTNAEDPRLVPAILDPAEAFEPMDEGERAALVEHARDTDTPVPRQ